MMMSLWIFFSDRMRNSDMKYECLRIIARNFAGMKNNLNSLIRALQDIDTDDIPVRYVYAATDNQGRVKIGISNNPERRLMELNTGNADELRLIFVKETVNERYSDETALHNTAKQYHIRSEWFDNRATEVLQ